AVVHLGRQVDGRARRTRALVDQGERSAVVVAEVVPSVRGLHGRGRERSMVALPSVSALRTLSGWRDRRRSRERGRAGRRERELGGVLVAVVETARAGVLFAGEEQRLGRPFQGDATTPGKAIFAPCVVVVFATAHALRATRSC